MKCIDMPAIFLMLILPLLIASGCIAQETIWEDYVQQQEKIIAESSKKLELNPKDAVAYYKRGEAYRLIEQYDKAILDFNKAIDIYPEYARAYEGRADAYFGLNKTDAANDDLKKAEEIDPTIFDDEKNWGFGYVSETSKKFIFPAVDAGKRHREGDLVLGSTTMKQAVKMLPGWPGHGPTRISKNEIETQAGKVGEVLRNVRYTYNPMIAGDLVLVFDKNKILVVIHVFLANSISPESNESKKEQERITNMMKVYQFEEVSRNKDTITMRGEIMPCITVDIFVPVASEEPVSTIEYYFTCPTA
jgi:hypothetical protein